MYKSPSNNKNSYNSSSSLDDVLKASPYENVLEPVASPLDHSDLAEDEKVYRVSLNILPVFFLEALALGSLAALAYVMRFMAVFPVLKRGFFCGDKSINYGKSNSLDGAITEIKSVVFYPVLIAVPLGMIIAGELFFWLCSGKPRKVVRGGCVGCRLHQPLRRLLRFVGLFFLGLLVTSIITDSLKMATGRLTPTFMSVCKTNLTDVCQGYQNKPEGIYLSHDDYTCTETKEEIVNKERLSFPSFHASTSAFASVYCMAYIHWLMSGRTASRLLLLPCLQGVFATVALMCSALDVALHNAHWEDALVGTILGIMVAVYLTYYMLNGFRERTKRRPNNSFHTNDDLENSLEKIETGVAPTSAAQVPSSLFFRYLRIPHVNYRNRTGRSYSENEGPTPRQQENNLHNHLAGSKPASLHEEFQRDLHQRIEDYVTKRLHQDS